jgi:hypothetical protein
MRIKGQNRLGKQTKTNLSRVDPLVGLIEDNVGGLIESPERTLQQQDELTSHRHHMARQQETEMN